MKSIRRVHKWEDTISSEIYLPKEASSSIVKITTYYCFLLFCHKETAPGWTLVRQTRTKLKTKCSQQWKAPVALFTGNESIERSIRSPPSQRPASRGPDSQRHTRYTEIAPLGETVCLDLQKTTVKAHQSASAPRRKPLKRSFTQFYWDFHDLNFFLFCNNAE